MLKRSRKKKVGFFVIAKYLDGVKAPSFDMISVLQRHSHDTIERYSQQLFLLFAVEPNNK